MSIFEESRRIVIKALVNNWKKEDVIRLVSDKIAEDGTDRDVAIFYAKDIITRLTKDIIWQQTN